MSGFFHWFKSSTKMKRWMLLILVGIILACYGIAEILVLKEVSFLEVGKIIVIFVVGFACIVLGLIFLNKRTLEVLIESTDERMENRKNVNVKSLIFNKTIYDKGPNIVVIGGGTGLNTVLSGIKNYTNNVTAIVTVSDYGRTPSNSRKELNVLPMEDIKESIVSLSLNEEEIRGLLNYEFDQGKLKGLNFGDIYFSAMEHLNGDFAESIKKSNEVFNIIGNVMPVTLDEVKICAELENGYVVEEKDRIPEVVYDKLTKISRIYLTPSNCKPAPGVIEAIKNADGIIIGPGSLYTNVIPNLLVNGVAKAIKESPAMKIFISNIMTVPGQTDEYSISDHIQAIVDHCGDGMIDYCIYDTGEVIPEFIKKYNLEGADLVEQDIEKAKTKFKGVKFLQRNLSVISSDFVRHDPNLVASSVIELICDDLKYQDKQNDPQYLMMNTKLKEDKRINKLKRAAEKAEKKNKKDENTDKSTHKLRSKSKFSSKYSDRIESIKNSDRKDARVRARELAKLEKKVEKKNKAKEAMQKSKKSEPKKTKATKEKEEKKNVKKKVVKKNGPKRMKTKKDKGSKDTKSSVPKRMKTKDDIKAEMEEMLKHSKLK